MGYFENNIYVQTPHCGVRNTAINNFNTSSDFCIFSAPTYTMNGAGKLLACTSKSDCSLTLSANTLSNLETIALTDCFINQSLQNSCHELTRWQTKISENNVVVYSADFYTTTTYSGDTPTDAQFSGSVITAFDALGYDYTLTGTSFTLTKPYGTTNLTIDLCVSFDISDTCLYYAGLCGCPTGYTETLDTLGCLYSATTAATFNGSGDTIVAATPDADFSTFGAYFYTNETNNQALPLTRVGFLTNTLEDQTGGTITYTHISDVSNSFWDSLGSTLNGRLNNVGLSASTTEWLGFSHCIDITTGGTYYIGIAADNRCRFNIDGQPFLDLDVSSDRNHKIWHVLPYDFTAGKHIIEMEGLNDGAATAFGAEIYFPTDLATLTGATTTGDTGLIFSTADKIGGFFDLGTTMGYSCPSGWALDICTSAATCVELIYTGKTEPCYSAFTGTCDATCVNICDQDFSAATTANTSVHIISTATTQDITFQFTGGTSEFVDSNTTFKFDIFKLNPSVGYFQYPPQYRSEEFEWSSFSGTSALTQSIPLSALNIDGEYMIKGYFVHDMCTEFAKRLGYRNDTSSVLVGSEYNLFEPATDFHMSIFRGAEKPVFDTNLSGTRFLSLKQKVVIPADGQTVFMLSGDINQDFVMTVNGLVLSNNLDYSVTQYSGGSRPYIVELSAATKSSDIVTFIYASTESGGLRGETFNITSIPSGPTDGQGSSDIYYNTTTSKYELFLSLTPSSGNDILIMLNGVVLANGVDYYQSISNPKRIIFEGTILVGDVITAAYNQSAYFIDSINTPTPNISWRITTPPTIVNGYFTLEFASDNGMTTIVSSATTEYVVNQSSYSLSTTISGSVGTELYYRVKNTKEYETICGDIIDSTAYSEVIPITIATNSINSY